MKQNDHRDRGIAGIDPLLEDNGEIIELTEKVTADHGRRAAADLAGADEEVIELTDRVLSHARAPEGDSAGRRAENTKEKLIDTIDLDEAMHSLGDRLGADSGPSSDEHLGFTTTLDDTLEFDEGILDLTMLDETTPAGETATESPMLQELSAELPTDLFDEDFDPALLDQVLDDEQIIGLSSEPPTDLAAAAPETHPAKRADSEISAEDLTETIELDDLIASDLSELEGIEEPLTEDLLDGLNLDEELDAESEQRSVVSDDIIDNLGMEIEPALPAALAIAATTVGGQAAPLPTFSKSQLQRALARAIREVYAERIEGLLLTAIEKTVTREIGRLKTLLRNDSPDTEPDAER